MKTKGGYICDEDGYTGHTGDTNPKKHLAKFLHALRLIEQREDGQVVWEHFRGVIDEFYPDPPVRKGAKRKSPYRFPDALGNEDAYNPKP